ncbi:MAG: hypothetical protein NT150_03585 [Bacteroidetes bacterium]|nr:hypothetical protein [Bacteroidota bacterium]
MPVQINYWDYDKAKAFVRRLKLGGVMEWRAYVQGSNKNYPPLPKEIPSTPQRIYAKKGQWKDWGDFLGVYYLAEVWPYHKAKDYVRTLGFGQRKEWIAYYKKNRSSDANLKFIPQLAEQKYKRTGEWISWEDFLGKRTLRTPKQYWPYLRAKKFASTLGISTSAHWRLYAHGRIGSLPPIPKELPKSPNIIYAKEWESWEKWLGPSFTGIVKYRPYEQVKAFAKKVGIRTYYEWRAFASGKVERKDWPKFPKDIPKSPDQVYAEFEGYAVFLGHPEKKRRLNCCSFEKAREFVSALGLLSERAWVGYCKGKMKKLPKLPDDIPLSPDIYYEEWRGWPYFLGKSVPPPRNFVGYEMARNAAIKNNIKSAKEWRVFVSSKLAVSKIDLNSFLPKYPNEIYQRTGHWKSWAEFLGTGRRKRISKEDAISFAKAKAFVKGLNLKNRKQWFKYIKGEMKNLPALIAGFPQTPNAVYKAEWKGWGDFLGTGNVVKSEREYWSYERAQSHVEKQKIKSVKEWLLYCKGKLPGRDLKPKEIPSNVHLVYKKKWKGYPAFFGR